MQGKPRPLVALNSIVSSGPRTSAETRVVLMESEFTAPSPVEGARCLKKSASLCQEGPHRGWRIWGATLRIYGADVGPRAFHVSRVPNWTPDEAVENNFNAACGFGPLC